MDSTSFNRTPSSSAALTSLPTRWDVFLSFRGRDTRLTFTDHLYSALHRNGVRTFRDEPELRSGEVISDGLLQAIQKSKTYVIVLSENYASSHWCLDELVEILNCYNTMQRLVIPIFYNTDPSAVGHQTGGFREAFEKHETRFDKERLDKWRVALTIVGKLSGKVCKNMYEAQFIDEIVDQILLEINPKTLDVAKYPVGLGPRVKELTALLGSGTQGVTKIGLYGMGGVGKTTLAKALYNHLLLRSFQGSCFLANVREVSGTTRGLESLQQQLINDVLKRKQKVNSVEQGIIIIRERICSAKILVLIDDLEDLDQYESLVGPFASGSVVIITTRDEEILEKIEVESRYRYRVNELNDAESLTLFTKHAFENADADNGLKLLSTDILRLAGGLPLALKVFGSHLYKRSKVGWVAYIKKLQKVPHSSIQQRLMISLDALESDDPMLKKLFLDISCVFVGWAKGKVFEILETYYPYADYYIDILMKRCLLTINNEVLGMHDLLRDIGRDIARNNSPDEPGKHSRLWASKEIDDVLKIHKGTEAIEVIMHRILGKEHVFAAETFRRMRKLRFLQLTGVSLIGSFECTLENLRWLCWEYCPLECFPSEFNSQQLVVLELPCSRMIQMWESGTASQVFDNLKSLNMSNSYNLTTTSDFAKLPSLETLNLESCESLVELDISIGSLGRLVSLNLRGCKKLRSLPDAICNLRALEVLNIGGCFNVEALPEELGSIKSLKELDAHNVALSKLPDSIGRLSKLVKLILTCHEKFMTIYHKDHGHHTTLKNLPDTICNLRELEVLSIGYSGNLAALPVELGNIESLKELNVQRVIVSTIPDAIGCLSNLVKLRLTSNKNLQTLPKTIGYLSSLEFLDISFCKSLIALPVELGNIESLKELDARDLAVSELPNSIGHLSKLVKLTLRDNTQLRTLPDTICNLRSLEILDINYCSSLKALPVNLGQIESLKELHAQNIAVLKIPDSVGRLTKLVKLGLQGNKNLRTLPDTISNMRSLEILNIDNCSSLEALPAELGNIESLKEFRMKNIAVSILPDSIGCLTKLVELRLRGNKNLVTLPSTICNMRSLEVLNISGCEKVEFLPDQLWEITRMKELYASGLTMLKRLPDIESTQLIALSLKKLDLSKNVITALPCGISRLLNLEHLDLRCCGHLLSIVELPSNLKILEANACKSMKMLPNLSNLERLKILDLTDCCGLTELHGLEELTCIKTLRLASHCNLSLTKHLFQIYSRFGHEIQICIPSTEFPDWIRESPDWIPNNCGSTLSMNLPPNVSDSFSAMILCFGFTKNGVYYPTGRNITSDFIWKTTVRGSEHRAVLLVLPKLIFSVKGDDGIEMKANTEIHGICLVYETETAIFDAHDKSHHRQPSKRFKYLDQRVHKN